MSRWPDGRSSGSPREETAASTLSWIMVGAICCDTARVSRTRPGLRAAPALLALVLAACAGGRATSAPIMPTSSAPPSAASPTGTLAPSGSSPSAGSVSLGLEPFADGLADPVFVTHAGDGSGLLYVVERGGTIRIIESDGSVRPDPFLDISERVVAGGEQGLLGLAFHPAYRDDGRFYVMYTAAGDGANTVSEFTASGGAGDPASERVLLSIADFAGNHNGGMVAFGPDGHLYVGTGDGGGGGDPEENGQDPFALLGKILRIDVDGTGSEGSPYAIPADNPFSDGSRAAPEVWAIGMRNPWRFSFDRETGDLWIGDVGQGRWEEIDAEPAGAGGRNYGWDTMEGPDCFEEEGCDTAGLTLPVAAYTHDEGSCTVIGGHVYRGARYPDATGTYVYGDFCSGLVWGLDAAAAMAAGTAEPVLLLEEGMSLSAFGEDEEGELYAVDLGGRILRLVWE